MSGYDSLQHRSTSLHIDALHISLSFRTHSDESSGDVCEVEQFHHRLHCYRQSKSKKEIKVSQHEKARNKTKAAKF
jgi:hypothetical protein